MEAEQAPNPVHLSPANNALAETVLGDIIDSFTGEDEADLSRPEKLMERAMQAIERRATDLDRDQKNLIARNAVTDLITALNKEAKRAVTLEVPNTP